MKARQGIALVTTLLVGASILVFGLGSMFLTHADLSIGDNVRANAVAKYRAHIVFEASVIALQQSANTHGIFPASLSAPRLTLVEGPSGAFVRTSDTELVYTHLSHEQALLQATGKGPREASFMTEGVLELGSLSQLPEPVGLSAGGSVTIGHWGATRITDASVHGNAGYSFAEPNLANMGACSSRQLDGRCAIWLPYDMSVDADSDGIPDSLNVTAAEDLAAYTCAPSGHADLCEMIAGSPAPRQRRAALNLGLDTNAQLAEQLSSCDQTYLSPPILTTQADVISAGFTSGQSVCVSSGSLAFPSGTSLEGVQVIVEDGDIELNGGSISGSKLIAKDGALRLSSATVSDSFLYSKSNLSLTSSVTLQGGTNVVAGASLDFAAIANPTTGGDGSHIGVRVYAQGNIRYAPSSDSFAYFHSGGSFVADSTQCILGSVKAALDITASQGICLDSGLALGEAEPLDTSVRVVSRR